MISAGSTVTAVEGNVEAVANGDIDMLSGLITAKDLTLYSRQGSVGTIGTGPLSNPSNPIRTDISGVLDVNSAKSVVVHQESTEHDLTKMMRNPLRPLAREKAARLGWSEEQLSAFLADPVFSLRPETLSVEDFVALTLKLS